MGRLQDIGQKEGVKAGSSRMNNTRSAEIICRKYKKQTTGNRPAVEDLGKRLRLISSAGNCHYGDFNVGIAGKTGYAHGGAGREVARKIPAVDFIDL